MAKRFADLESEFEGLDPGLLDEVIGYDDTEDPDLPFDSTAFAGAPSSVRRPPSPLGGGALAGNLPAPTRSRFSGFGDAPDMEFSLDETESAPDMTFSLEETEPAPDMSFTLDEVDEQQREPDMAFTLEETETPFAPDVAEPRLFSASEVFGDSSPFADDVQAEVPGASRPVLSPTETDQDEASGDPTATTAQAAARPPRARTMGVDDAFDPMAETSAERAAIARGERQDRRRRIAGGVLSGLGMLMAAGGGRGSGLGAALGGIGSMIGRSATREDRARADMQARLTSERERMMQDRQAARDDADAERRDAELELRRALAGSTIDLNRSRMRMSDAELAESEAERAAQAGDAAGMRNALRRRADASNDPSKRAQLRAMVAGVDSMTDLGAMSRILASMNALDPRRGTSGGGGGGGSRSEVAVDPVTGEYVAVRQRASVGPRTDLAIGQGRSAAEVAEAAAQDAADAAAASGTEPAPSATPARRPRPAAAASGAAPAGPQVLGNDPVSWGNRLRADLSRTGRTPEQVQSIANDLVAQYNDPRTRRQAVAEANRYRRDANAAPEAATAEPDRAERARWNSTVAPLQTSAGELREMVRFLRANRGEIRQALLSGDVSGLALTPVQRRIRSLITAQLSETIHRLAGAAVSAQELERIQRMMQTDTASVAANPDSAIRAIDHQLGQIVRELGNRRATFTANDEQWFMQRARGGAQ